METAFYRREAAQVTVICRPTDSGQSNRDEPLRTPYSLTSPATTSTTSPPTQTFSPSLRR
jgi:hypothetical protein